MKLAPSEPSVEGIRDDKSETFTFSESAVCNEMKMINRRWVKDGITQTH